MNNTNIPENTIKCNTDEIAAKVGGVVQTDAKTRGRQKARVITETQLDCSDRFVCAHQSKLRFVPAWGKWMVFDGQRWKLDDTNRAHAHVITFLKTAHDKQQSRSYVDAIMALAKCDQRLTASPDQWDTHDYLLPCPSGTIDLRTGDVREADPLDYMTGLCPVSPAERGIEPTVWLKYQSFITDGDDDLLSFKRRMHWYCLSGLTTAHALFFGYGTGRNGKGVEITTLQEILGPDYAKTADSSTFTASFADRHTTELAMLRGARLVAVTETEQNRRWAEARIKAVTGGDQITARFMRQDNFTFTPKFKLFVTGNHKPMLSAVDEAMKRRVKIIPYPVTIPKGEEDEGLQDKLRAEYPAILRWMLDGYAEYVAMGFDEPDCVKEASAGYFESQDTIGGCLESFFDIQPEDSDEVHCITSKKLFSLYKQHCKDVGVKPTTESQLAEQLVARGFVKKQARYEGKNTKCWFGLRAKPEIEQDTIRHDGGPLEVRLVPEFEAPNEF